jgi:hypothetical protein
VKNKFLSYLRSFLLSPEFLLLLAASGVVAIKPSCVQTISGKIRATSEYAEWASLAPIAVCIWTFGLIKNILFPAKDEAGKLQKHPEYSEVRIVCNVAYCYALFFAALGICAAVNVGPPKEGMPMFMLLVAVLGSLIVGLSCWQAHLKIDEIFCEETD